MNQSEDVFSDFPIEYFQLNKEDFSKFQVDKTFIKTSDYSYLSNVLETHITLEDKNTVVINTPVGNGKSYGIIQTIKRFYDAKEDYLIFVAAPFVSLVEQYYQDIHKITGIPVDSVYNYNNIGRNDTSYLDKRIQVVTANLLLGNAGEDSYKNSDKKREYLNNLKKHCEENDIKVVFIYDEIHDTIYNFKEELIFNLWKWKKVIHKNFIISATFNEASKVVIEYLAELTDRKIQIIESDRSKNSNNLSDLILYYSSSHQFSPCTNEIKDVILDILRRGKSIDVLCYSKTLSEAIINDELLGQKLKEKFGEINNCTSQNIDNQRPNNEVPQNRFDNNKCNIGTNFKSGVSIEKENHAFVIIMPPRGAKSQFKNYYGIFSSGITSIIQALARKRKAGEIHIILPRPDEFNLESLTHLSPEQLKVFSHYYNRVKHIDTPREKVNYIPLCTQSEILQKFYAEERKNLEEGIKYSSEERKRLEEESREPLVRLEYPPFKNWLIIKGENYLADTFPFLGNDLSSYITYCAFTNQFVNCTLSKINAGAELSFEEGKIQHNLSQYFNEYFGEHYIESFSTHFNFHYIYNSFRVRLFKEFILKYKKGENENHTIIKPFKIPSFERHLIRFIALQYYGVHYTGSGGFLLRYDESIDFSLSDYFIQGISSIINIDIEELEYDDSIKERFTAFQNLNYFREKMISNIGQHSRGSDNYQYLPVKPFQGFIQSPEDIQKFNQLADYFINRDSFISEGVFEFIRNFSKYSEEQRINSFYSILLNTFFNLETRTNDPKLVLDRGETRVKPIISTKEIPTQYFINLVEPPMDITTQEHIEAEMELLELKTKEEYNRYFEKINKLLS